MWDRAAVFVPFPVPRVSLRWLIASPRKPRLHLAPKQSHVSCIRLSSGSTMTDKATSATGGLLNRGRTDDCMDSEVPPSVRQWKPCTPASIFVPVAQAWADESEPKPPTPQPRDSGERDPVEPETSRPGERPLSTAQFSNAPRSFVFDRVSADDTFGPLSASNTAPLSSTTAAFANSATVW